MDSPRDEEYLPHHTWEPTSLHIAAEEGDIENLRNLLRQNLYDINSICSTQHFTALHLAAKNGHLEACKLLLRAGADPNLKTLQGDTALQILSSHAFENEAAYNSTVDMMLKQSCSIFSRPSSPHYLIRRSRQKRSNTEPRFSPPIDDDDDNDSAQLDISDSSSNEYCSIKSRKSPDTRRTPFPEHDSSTNELHKDLEELHEEPNHSFDSDSDNQSSESDKSTKPKISYPPSPLSTEFETTESSEIGGEQYTINPRETVESEQEQAISSSMRDILLDTMNLRKLRYKHKFVKSTVPSVLRKEQGSPHLYKIKGTSLKRNKRSYSHDIITKNEPMHPSKSSLPSRTSVGRLVRSLLDPLQTSKDPFFVIDFLKIHRFFLSPQTLLKNMILRYTFNTDESVPQKVNCSILRTRTRILEVMICWLKTQFTDFWQHEDVIDTANKFVDEISASDDPPETLPISEIMELKETLANLCENFHPPPLPIDYEYKLYTDNDITLSQVSPIEFADELTLYLNDKFRTLTPMDFALFHQNQNIILECPHIVQYYETIDKLKRWITTVILLQPTRKKRSEVIEYFITVASVCLEYKNYQGAQIVLHTLTSESIGRLNETWGLVSASKLSKIQHVMSVLSKSVNFELLVIESTNSVAFIPDIEMIFQEYITHCTSVDNSRKQTKINFKQARKVLSLNKYLNNVTYPIEPRDDIRELLERIDPLPEELLVLFSRSHEQGKDGKPKAIPLIIHGVHCKIVRGSLVCLHGKIEDLLDLLLDPNLVSVVRDITEELFLTHKYYISAGDLCHSLLHRLEIPSLTKCTLAEQTVVMHRHLQVRSKVTELFQKWFAMHAAKLKKDAEMKRVLLDFAKRTNFLSVDETFFYITTLCNSFRSNRKPHSSAHRLKEGVDNFSLGGPAWTDDIIFKQQFPKIASKQFCLFDSELFRKITAMDLLSYSAFPKKKSSDSEGSNKVELWSTRFNTVSNWVSAMIIKQTELEKRVLVLKQFIKLADCCLALNNFNTSYAIFAALFSVSISRLRNTWKEISPSILEKFHRLQFVFDTMGGHRHYQDELEKAKLPVIPWLGIYTKHIFSIREHNPDMKDDTQVNFEKFTSLVKILRKVFQLQSVAYDFTPDLAAQQYLTDLHSKILTEAEINARSQKLELNKVQNPLFNSKLSFTSPNKDGGGSKMILSKGKRGELQTSLQRTNSFHFTQKTFVDEEGRKTVHVKNPIFQNSKLLPKTPRISPGDNESHSGDDEKIKSKKRSGIRRFFPNPM